MTIRFMESWRLWAKSVRQEIYALYLASQDRRVPWYAKALAVAVVAYALSPIDLIPDFVPILGYLDDLILVPLGVACVIKMVPAEVLEECRRKAGRHFAKDRPKNWIAGGVVIFIWVAFCAFVGYLVVRKLKEH